MLFFWRAANVGLHGYIQRVGTALKNSSNKPLPVGENHRQGDAGWAAANAAAASFANLTAKLDYLSAADLEQVRKGSRA